MAEPRNARKPKLNNFVIRQTMGNFWLFAQGSPLSQCREIHCACPSRTNVRDLGSRSSCTESSACYGL